MKKVVSKSEVLHFFANNVQEEARVSANNLSYVTDDNNGDLKMYSYSTVIAKRTIINNEVVFFITNKNYSNTTSGQVYDLLRAVQGSKVIRCAYPNGYALDNLNAWGNKINDLRAEANAKKQERSKVKLLIDIENVKKEAQIYIDILCLDVEKECVALFELMKCENLESLNEAIKIAEEKETARKLERQKQVFKEKQKEVKDWRKFGLQKVYLGSIGLDYLRFNSETNRIETTQGVEIPLRTAKSFYNEVMKTIKTGECKVCGTYFMERYEIREINKDFIVIGCHKIEIKEIKSLAKKMNW